MIKLHDILGRQARIALRARALFDDGFYVAANPDVGRGRIDPFVHYLKHGWKEGRDPAPGFSTLYYKDRHLAGARRPINPLLHFAGLSAAKRAALPTRAEQDFLAVQAAVIAPFFDPEHYRGVVDTDGVDPLAHYLAKGWRQGFEPRADFDTQSYLGLHRHVRRLGLNPFYHFVSTYPLLHDGQAPRMRGDAAKPGSVPRTPPQAREARAVYDLVEAAFDKTYYLAHNADVREAEIDPVVHFLDHGVAENRHPNEFFWTGYYRKRYAAALGPGANPFVHYLSEGRARGDKTNPYSDRLWPKVSAPAAAAWGRAKAAAGLDAAEVVLIMPVYKGYDDTLAAIFSVLTNRQETPFALLVIDDQSPDAALSAALDDLAGRGLFALTRNPRNLGFVSTVNRGIAQTAGKDVVLLNADILVFGDWLDRLLRHAADPRVATITPFSNNATICSYPEMAIDNRLQLEVPPEQLDAFAAVCNAGRASPVPTGVGFCLYMRRAAIEAVGALDVETFGRGYGEENDFCMRATAQGYRHLLAQDVFVFHSGSVSFGTLQTENSRRVLTALDGKHPGYRTAINNHIKLDPARAGRLRLDVYRLARALARKVALLVTHTSGGGIETHVQQLSRRLDAAGYDVLLLRCADATQLQLDLPDDSTTDFSVDRLDPISLAMDRDLCADVLRWLAPSLVHVHSLVNLDWRSTCTLMTLIRQTCPGYYFTLHDYAPVCHRNNLVTPEQSYCGLPGDEACSACQRIDPDAVEYIDPAERRRAYAAFLGGARAVLSPSEDVLRRIGRRIPLPNAVLRPHEGGLVPATWRAAPAGTAPLKVAALGAIGPHKGADLLHSLALDARARDLPVAFSIVGYSYAPARTQALGIWESGRYEGEAEAYRILNEERFDLVLLPAIWPETFSYTLSMALAAGIPPVVFDLGAPADRLRALGEGAILDPALALDPLRLNDTLLALDLASLWARRTAPTPVHYARFPDDYYVRGAAEAAA